MERSHKNRIAVGLGFLTALSALATVLFIYGNVPGDAVLSDATTRLAQGSAHRFFALITVAGEPAVLTSMACALVVSEMYARRWRNAIQLTALFVGMSVLVKLLKAMVHRPRPLADLYSGVEAFSFPSGHATHSALILGISALVAFRRPVTSPLGLACLVIIFLIGASRVGLGAHWPSDVLAGWLLAGLVFCFLRPQALVLSRGAIGLAFSFGLLASLFCYEGAVKRYSTINQPPSSVVLPHQPFDSIEQTKISAYPERGR